MSVIPSFQQSVKYSSRSLSVHSVARFIVGRHFDTKCVCSDLRTPCSVPPRPHFTLDRLGSLILSELDNLDVNVERMSEPTTTIL